MVMIQRAFRGAPIQHVWNNWSNENEKSWSLNFCPVTTRRNEPETVDSRVHHNFEEEYTWLREPGT
jgi:hypothetical protein